MNAEAAGPNVTTVATVTAVTKQPKTLDTNRSEVNGTYPAATASRAAKARKSVGACVTAVTGYPGRTAGSAVHDARLSGVGAAAGAAVPTLPPVADQPPALGAVAPVAS
ncbi:Uncharacterised protein [Mycobacterium tuberculosis]|nr:Uncharacterised protein [Mycobacterium tuberculosis]